MKKYAPFIVAGCIAIAVAGYSWRVVGAFVREL